LLDLAFELGRNALALPCDLTEEESVASAFVEAMAWSPLSGVVASAGVQLFGEDAGIGELDLDVFDRTAAVNIRGAVITGKYAAKALRLSGGGSIVLIGSPTGIVGQASKFAAYSTSKAAIFGLSRVMAAELAPDGIRVNVVVPGFTDTPLVRDITQSAAATEAFISKIPLGRAGTPGDVATAVGFLLGPESSYVTGSVLTVDGGMLAV
jgi:NAD(P)-dependent dehydrogenase (short-subunit alcohol dehydrogenase family)